MKSHTKPDYTLTIRYEKPHEARLHSNHQTWKATQARLHSNHQIWKATRSLDCAAGVTYSTPCYRAPVGRRHLPRRYSWSGRVVCRVHVHSSASLASSSAYLFLPPYTGCSYHLRGNRLAFCECNFHTDIISFTVSWRTHIRQFYGGRKLIRLVRQLEQIINLRTMVRHCYSEVWF